MRAALALAAAAVMAACGAPSVELPQGNDRMTSDAGGGELPTPVVQPVPKRYPYARLAVRGSAPNGTRVIIEGAGNPVTGNVQPLDNSFCVDVTLAAAPAQYTLAVQTQSGDGRLSDKASVSLERDRGAPPPPDAKLCNGSSAAD